jgi:hypothetical protein
MFFPYVGNKNPIWLSYLSEGLKLPTSGHRPQTDLPQGMFCEDGKKVGPFKGAEHMYVYILIIYVYIYIIMRLI